MQSFDFKKFLPNIIIIVGMALLSVFYCFPVLEGKSLYQGDIKNWKAMIQEAKSWHETTGGDPLWSNSMFGGMPTYLTYESKNYNYVATILNAAQNILPKPANFIFLSMLCFFVLMCTLRVNRWLGAAGAIAYAFSTYGITCIVAGHDSKVVTMAFIPLVIAGLLITYRGRYLSGGLISALGFALLITASHLQIIYYTAIILFLAGVVLLFKALKEKQIKQFLIASCVTVVAYGLGVLPGMSNLMMVQEYSKATMRGGVSELTLNHDKNKKNGGLDKDYAFQWSTGIGESFCALIPNLYGGSSSQPIDDAPKAGELLSGGGYETVPLYWGDQPFLGGPSYFGAIVCFLFVLGILVIRSKHKWWIVAASLAGFMLAWGRNFPAFNYFLFDHLPAYNKFRTPSTALVIPGFLFPMLGIWALAEIVKGEVTAAEAWKKIKIAAGITVGLCLLLGVGGGMFFDFTNATEQGRYPAELVKALKEDRASLAMKSGLISAVYILLAAALIWAYLKKMVNANVMMIGVCALIAVDLILTDKKYLNDSAFIDTPDEQLFVARPVDKQILQDKDPYYRVLDLTTDVYNDATPAYFHKCIGGYSPAKLEIYQDLIDMQMNAASRKFNAQVLNMLNTKYIIFSPGQNAQPVMQQNPAACGNAWFVNEVKWAKTADEEMLSLNAGTLGDTAVVASGFEPLKTVVLRDKYQAELNGFTIGKDSAAYVKLTSYGLNDLTFTSHNSQSGVAVFSDIFYNMGWKAFVDGKETPIMKADYVLRAIKVPAGDHKIEFHFHPDTYYLSIKIAAASSILLLVLCIGGLVFVLRKQKDTDKAAA